MATTNTAGHIALNDRACEYIAQLCANLYVSVDQAPKVVALTAAERHEGKTSIGLGLAIQVRQVFNADVVFVEGNLRAPHLAKLLGLAGGRQGLAEFLAGECQLDDAVVSLGDTMPDVITAGTVGDRETIGSNLSKENVNRLFATLGERYSYIIVETPPINIYPEAQVIVSRADQVLLVIRAGMTSQETAALAVKRIEQGGSPAPMLVLNRKQYHVPEFLYRRL